MFNLFSPAQGFAMIKAQLEKQLKVKIETFDIIYNKDSKDLDIVIYNIFHEGIQKEKETFVLAGGQKLAKIVADMSAKHLEKNSSIDYCICKINKSEKKIIVYYQNSKSEKLIFDQIL